MSRLANAFTLIPSFKRGVTIGIVQHGLGFVESREEGTKTITTSLVGQWWDRRLSEAEINPKSAFSHSFYVADEDQCLNRAVHLIHYHLGVV